MEMVRRLSLAKAQAVADRADDPALVVGSDTTVVFEGQVMGKPSSQEPRRRYSPQLVYIQAFRAWHPLFATAIREKLHELALTDQLI